MATQMQLRKQAKTVSGIVALIGVWQLISPWALGFNQVGDATTSNVVTGLILLVLGAMGATRATFAPWMGWVNSLTGLWILLSPWLLGFSEATSALWNNIIFGIAAAVLGAWSASSAQAAGEEPRIRKAA